MPSRRARVALLCAVALAAAGCRTARESPRAARAVQPADDDDAPAGAGEPINRAPSAEAYRAVLESELLLDCGDASAAADQLRVAVLHDPASPWLRVRLGEVLLMLGDIESARGAAQEALTRAPAHKQALHLLATTWVLTGEKRRARRVLARALKSHPGDRAASTMMAELLLEDGRVKDAEAVVEALMSKEPDAIDGWLSLARLFGDRGEVGRAHVYVDRALERQSRSPEALALKIDLLHAQGRFADARPVAEKLARERGDSAGMRRAYLTAMLLADEREAAAELANTWILDDKSEHTLLIIVGAYENAGLRDEARRVLRDNAGEHPVRRLAVEAGRLALDDGDAARARELLCDVSEDEGADWFTFASSLCARALVRSGSAKQAARHLERALDAQPGSWRLLLALADAARHDGAGVSAKSVIERAASAYRKAPDDIDLLDALVRAHERLGDAAAARALLHEALKARPDHAELLLLLARFLERRGDAAAAVSIADRLLLRDNPPLELLNFQAFTLADHQLRPDEAEKLAWRALLQGPLNGYVVDTLGWAQFRAGKLEQARVTLLRADRLSPDEPEILLHLAETEHALGLDDAARATLAKTRGRWIDDDRVKGRINALRSALGEEPA